MKRLSVLFALTVLLLASVGAYALDLNLPPWAGEPGSTWAIWEFSNDNVTPVPDVGENIYGAPSVSVYPGFGDVWQSVWGEMGGVWPLSGAIEVHIPNNPVENERKLIQIQLTWAARLSMPNIYPVVTIEAERVNGQAIQPEDITLLSTDEVVLGSTNEPNDGEFWYHTTYLYGIVQNTVMEKITVSGSIMVDELVIDTICVPEPATVGLLALGALALLRRRKSA